jgi:ABC-type transport system involved in multi-copper enzyme maturation permease subunit
MNAWRELVSENPMLVEIRRVRSRMLSTRSGGANVAIIVLILVFYGFFVLSLLTLAKYIDPVIVVIFQTGLFSLLMPVMVSGSIAGERENRTWDILLVAPVTKAQIVVGKFIACLSGLAIFFVLCLLPIALCLIQYPGAKLSATISAEMLSASFGMLLIAFSLLVSARSRTTFAALGTCVGTVFILVGAVPIFIASVLQEAGATFLYTVYPFSILSWTLAHPTESPGIHLWGVPLANTAVYLVLTVVMLVAATATVRKMEEIKNIVPESEGKRGTNRA